MSLLRDEEIIASIIVQAPAIPLIDGIQLPTDPYSKDSPVQGASVDLHIGNIYIPGKRKNEEGSAENPRSEHSLSTGETAVVTTAETLHLPSTVAGFGFPPSRVSFRGLLMTNPGHIDPGYDGAMRFTVINMGKEVYQLNRGDRIVTVLLFNMEKKAHSDWRQRNPVGSKPPSPIDQSSINRLSHDFVDVERRAKKIARDQGVKIGLMITTGLAVLGTVVTSQALYHKDIEELKQRQALVEYDVKNRVDVEQKLRDFDNRLTELERLSTPKAKQNIPVTTTKKPGKQTP